MENRISVRQLCVAAFTGLLAPYSAVAGMDWRGALLAVPAILLIAWILSVTAGRSGGLSGALQSVWGKLLSIIYIVWGAFVAGTQLSLCAERLAAAAGGAAHVSGGMVTLSILAILPVAWMLLGKSEAFARAAELFYLVMLITAAAVVVLGAGRVELKYLTQGRTNFWSSFVTAAGMGCLTVYAVLLWKGGKPEERGKWIGWSAAAGVALTLLSAVTVGALSPGLTNAVNQPFFVMTVGLGKTARTEALIAVLWLVADVVFMGLLLHSCRYLCSKVLGWNAPKAVGGLLSVITLGIGLSVETWGDPMAYMNGVVPVGMLVLGGAIPLVLCLTGRPRQKGAGGS